MRTILYIMVLSVLCFGNDTLNHSFFSNGFKVTTIIIGQNPDTICQGDKYDDPVIISIYDFDTTVFKVSQGGASDRMFETNQLGIYYLESSIKYYLSDLSGDFVRHDTISFKWMRIVEIVSNISSIKNNHIPKHPIGNKNNCNKIPLGEQSKRPERDILLQLFLFPIGCFGI